ncbi:hypothetical protein [Pseudomonas sp. RL_105y_Pfl2_101]|uniref:hypothetical protein n=1 Tax=Pseudomonas sp. RL_105y_Pfl2_101 TaxID=3088708 RepID=UPI0030DC35F4
MSDQTELKRLAEAASPGKWDYEQDCLFFYVDGYTKHLMELCEGDDVDGIQQIENAKFIAAANPAAVLALIAENERLERKNANQSESIREYQDLVMGGDVSLGMLKADIRVTTGERDELRAEVAGLKTGYEAYEQVVQGLKAENEVLRRSADRYQWLRDKQTFIWLIQDWFPKDNVLTDVDAEIDAAMSKGEQS